MGLLPVRGKAGETMYDSSKVLDMETARTARCAPFIAHRAGDGVRHPV